MTDSVEEPARGGPFAWYQAANKKVRRVFWTCSVAWTLDAMDALVYQYLIPIVIAAFGISLAQAAAIASASYFASAVGGWMGGWLADKFGRVRILQITILWFSLFSFLSGFAQTYEQLLVLRVLQGLGFGAEWAVGAVLLGEIVARKDRGKAIGSVQSGVAVGSGLAALLAGPFVAMFPLELGWRVVFWVGLLPAILIFFVRRGDDDSEVFKKNKAQREAEKRSVTPLEIFRLKYLRVTALAALLAVGAQGAGYSVSSYLTTFLQNERGISASTAGIFVLLNSVGAFFGLITNAYFSDRFGRRMAFRLFGLGFIIATSIYLCAPLGSSAYLLIPAGIVQSFCQFGLYGSFGPYFTELFPTEIRASGQAFAYNFGRAVSGIFIQGVAIFAAGLALNVSMTVMGSIGVLCALVATVLLPETVGRDLNELDEKRA
ncbi:MFS transporter [Marinicaulis flavus]|uniref:MFS transporter n=2 Tax=Hyphococcus luteus TaxID=2058213 RepID=A0A2S7K2E8_9PROT|nr:MFS transporter [Marinicaulis flavus]